MMLPKGGSEIIKDQLVSLLPEGSLDGINLITSICHPDLIQKDKINQDRSRKRAKMTKSCQEIGFRSQIRSQHKYHQIICSTYLHPHQLHLLH